MYRYNRKNLSLLMYQWFPIPRRPSPKIIDLGVQSRYSYCSNILSLLIFSFHLRSYLLPSCFRWMLIFFSDSPSQFFISSFFFPSSALAHPFACGCSFLVPVNIDLKGCQSVNIGNLWYMNCVLTHRKLANFLANSIVFFYFRHHYKSLV